jgi:hypothetical protein
MERQCELGKAEGSLRACPAEQLQPHLRAPADEAHTAAAAEPAQDAHGGIAPLHASRDKTRENARWHQHSWAALQMAWGLVCIPLAPLLLTPIPNLPLYYAGYKVRTTFLLRSNLKSRLLLE